MAELDRIRARQGGCKTGQAVATTAGNLPAKWVFHAVGPVWHGGNDGEHVLLASCYRACLGLAGVHGVKTITFPSISTGIYGYPVDLAAEVAVKAVRDHLVDTVCFVLYDAHTYEAYVDAGATVGL